MSVPHLRRKYAALKMRETSVGGNDMAFNVGPDDNIKLTIREADNQIIAYLNGNQIYSKIGVNAGPLNDTIDLDASLRQGYNVLVVQGLRWGNSGPAFKVNVSRNGDIISEYDSHPDGQDAPKDLSMGLIFDFSTEIFLKEK